MDSEGSDQTAQMPEDTFSHGAAHLMTMPQRREFEFLLNDTLTIVCYSVSFSRKREKMDRRACKREEREIVVDDGKSE